MVKITAQEIERLGQISRIKITPDEVEQLAVGIEAVLEYASSLQAIAQSNNLQEQKEEQENVMRKDVVVKADRDALLDQAPEREDDYFVVPRIIKKN